jgi:SAM-dependent methyltransferase
VSGAHDDLVRAQFRAQAVTFTEEGFAARGLEWIVAQLAPASGDLVLDVAAGAAHLGRALARQVAQVCAVDLTLEMLAQGQRLAAAQGLPNVAFVAGDAAALPCPARQFDLVVCRLALHQVADPPAVVREMLRVTRPAGRIAITDMIAGGDPAVAAEANRLERLRDPSHHRTLTLTEIGRLLTSHGASITATARRDHPLDLEDWMSRTATPLPARTAIRQRLHHELAGGPPTGLRPRRGPTGAITLTHQWATITAVPHHRG